MSRSGRWQHMSAISLKSLSFCATAVIGVITAASPSAVAQTWDGETSALWNVGTNWNTDTVPVSNGSARIDINNGGAANQPVLNVNANVNTIEILNGSTLTLQTGFNLTARDIRISGPGSQLTTWGGLSNAVEMELQNSAKLIVTGNEQIGSLSGNGSAEVKIDGVTLTVGDGENTTFSGVISGPSGNLVKTGVGTLTLSGTNTYTGTTTVNQGALAVGSLLGTNALPDVTQVTLNGAGALLVLYDETIGSLASASVSTNVLLGNNTLTTGGNGDSTTFDGVIQNGPPSANGSLIKEGTGTFTVTNTNTYTGQTTVNGGTLNVTGSIASTSVVVNNNGVLQVDGASLVDTAQVALNGTGKLKLDGSETIGALTGVGGSSVDLGANTLTTGDSTSTTFAGTMSGSGSLVKQGAGTFSITGNNTFTGSTNVTAGTLNVTGALAGPVNVQSGATLIGTGSVGSLTVASGGTMSPGPVIGTLTVNGNLTLASGSTTAIDINTETPNVDLINVTGTASVGGTLNINDVTATRSADVSGVYTIIQATSVTGTFGTVTHNFLLVTPNVDYLTDRVNITFERNETPISGLPGSTPNQNAVGNAIDSTFANLSEGSPAYQTLVNQLLLATDPETVLDHLDQLSGAEYAQHVQSVLWSTRAINRIVTERMECGDSAGDYARADGSGASLTVKDAPMSATGCFEPGEVSMWMRGFGSWNSLDGDRNAPGFDETQYGILFGADYSFNDSWFLGAAGGYFDSNGSYDSFGGRSGASIDYDGLQLAAYGGFDNSTLYVRGIAAYGNYSGDSRRGISGPGTVAGQLTGAPSSDVISLYGETGYRLSPGGLANITPFVGLGVTSARIDGFTEKDKDGTGAALRFDDADASSTISMLGMRLDSLLDMGSGVFTPELSVAWAHEFGDAYQTLDASFAEGPPGTDFTVMGSEVARDSLVVGADLNMALTAGLDLRLSYDGWFNGDYASNAVTAKLGWSF
jgi:outer membrane autotransporter protein